MARGNLNQGCERWSFLGHFRIMPFAAHVKGYPLIKKMWSKEGCQTTPLHQENNLWGGVQDPPHPPQTLHLHLHLDLNEGSKHKQVIKWADLNLILHLRLNQSQMQAARYKISQGLPVPETGSEVQYQPGIASPRYRQPGTIPYHSEEETHTTRVRKKIVVK